jgi:phage baseplate assembly protein gpV
VVCLLVIGACGGGDEDADDGVAAGSKSTTTTKEGTTSTAEATGSTAKAGAPGAEDPWRTTAMPYRTKVGEKYTLDCPPGGKPGSVWGVETYTADSSICTAAVHVGLITFEKGGDVEYEIAAGQDEYQSASAHDVLSSHYGRFDGSFTFPKAPPGSGDFTIGAESWQRTAAEYRGKNGERFSFECAPGGPTGSVWGTGTYTDDSSVCSAAVHAGLLTVEKGGKVTIEIAAGKSSYEGTTAYGVTSSDYGSYAGSFTFAR